MRKGLWVFLPLAGFLALAVLLASGLGKDSTELKTALADRPVPAFSLPSLLRQGTTVSNEVFLDRWSLLNVWATWCPTCHVEHPYLLELDSRGVAIIGLNYKDDADAARAYLAERGNPFIEVPVDADGRVGLDLGVYGAPETFLVNPAGKVVLRHVGEVNERVWNEKFAPHMEATPDA